MREEITGTKGTNVKPADDSGAILNANYRVSGQWPRYEVTFESGDGKGRNSDYTSGVEVVVSRLAGRGATLLRGWVSSTLALRRRDAEGIDIDLRLDDFAMPLVLSAEIDFVRLRKSIGRAGAIVGKPPAGSGNTTKRISLEVLLGAGPEISADDLEISLAIPPRAAVGEEMDGAPPIASSDPIELERLRLRYRDATPTVIAQLSRRIERGGVGERVKAANDYRCQICEQMGLAPTGFLRPDGRPYVEAHHVVLVSTLQRGALGPENVITVCANHHRELHYGVAEITDEGETFLLRLAGTSVRLRKNGSPTNGIG